VALATLLCDPINKLALAGAPASEAVHRALETFDRDPIPLAAALLCLATLPRYGHDEEDW
jgi:hypothetical protein